MLFYCGCAFWSCVLAAARCSPRELLSCVLGARGSSACSRCATGHTHGEGLRGGSAQFARVVSLNLILTLAVCAYILCGLLACLFCRRSLATSPVVGSPLLYLGQEELVKKVFTFVEQHICAGPSCATPTVRRLAIVYLRLHVL